MCHGFRRVAQPPQRLHDRATKQVGDGREQHERSEQRGGDATLRRPGARVDCALRRERHEREAVGARQVGRAEAAEEDAADVDASRPGRTERDRRSHSHAGDDAPVAHGDEQVALGQRHAQRAQQGAVDGNADRDLAQDAGPVDDVDAAHRGRCSGRADVEPRPFDLTGLDRRDDARDRDRVVPAQSPLHHRAACQASRLGGGPLEAQPVAGDGAAQRGLEPAVDPPRLPSLGERVVAVEGDPERN